ncbi:hypothetical protein H4P12_09615 [Paracoccus sp. 11-3]|uniref:Uncharacterized protein n=1 Tax=Paracoccus amoyensis TaxID=2760093 RepID=A0A926JDH3_9RHOB|nr:hypothetical protein [Paracoccus amoyensis]MBC9246968.1 hypothetical protein [Paracoccus amoyensis]
MTGFLLLVGTALCAVSVILAMVQLMRMQPPRTAAITLIVGIVLIFVSAYLDPKAFQASAIVNMWSWLTGSGPQTR